MRSLWIHPLVASPSVRGFYYRRLYRREILRWVDQIKKLCSYKYPVWPGIQPSAGPVWPGIQPSAEQNLLAGGGFKLPANKAHSLQLPPLWSGCLWGRHGCTFDRSGRGHCATGDCSGSLSCNGAGGSPPTTLAEITLGHELDFYDVSLVDGYNLAMSIMPVKGSGQCSYAGCVSDLNRMCPVGLQVRSRNGKRVVACKSACSAFNSPQYCCTGLFGNPQSCKPTAYSKIFKVACPKAYSYAYDDPTSIATCSKANYIVTFCPHHRH